MELIETMLSFNMNYVLMPDLQVLINYLAETGYKPPIVSGSIAYKGDVTITGDGRSVLGVRSLSCESLLGGIEELTEVLEKKMAMKLDESVLFCEFGGVWRIKADHNPLNRIHLVFEDSKLFEKIGRIFEEDVSPVTIHFAPKGKRPDSIEWFDITIEPVITLSDNMYFINSTCRSRNRNKVVSFLSNIEKQLVEIINIIGGG